MAEGERVLFDASAYMLFESSGDSEVEYFAGAVEVESDVPAAEDDAESCSWESLFGSAAAREVDIACGGDLHGLDFDEYYCSAEDEDGGGASEEETGVVNQCFSGGKAAAREASVVFAAAAKEKLNKSKALEDSNVKIINDE